MATFDSADAALLSAIEAFAKRAEECVGTGSTKPVVDYAVAAHHLAEARAWLISPNQPHGGSAKSS